MRDDTTDRPFSGVLCKRSEVSKKLDLLTAFMAIGTTFFHEGSSADPGP